MPNPLYTELTKNTSIGDPALSQFFAEVEQVKKSFRGDPRAEVENLLKTGRISQAQFNQYAQTANRLRSMMRS